MRRTYILFAVVSILLCALAVTGLVLAAVYDNPVVKNVKQTQTMGNTVWTYSEKKFVREANPALALRFLILGCTSLICSFASLLLFVVQKNQFECCVCCISEDNCSCCDGSCDCEECKEEEK